MATEASDLYDEASAAWRQGRPEQAAQLLSALLEQMPHHVGALNALALIALGRGDAASAVSHLEQAAAAEPGSQSIWFNLYQAWERAGDLERGLASLERALAIDPYFVPALLARADLLHRLGRLDESVALYRAIAAASPSLDQLPPAAREALARGLELVRADDERRAAALAGPL